MARKLSDRLIAKTAPPKQGHTFLWDLACTGLALKVTSADRRIWVMQTRYPGNSALAKRSLGQYPQMTLAAARQKATTWYDMARRGIDPSEQEQKAAEAQAKAAEAQAQAAALARENSFAAVLDDYAKKRLNRLRSGATVLHRLEREVLPVWRDKPITAITRSDVTSLIDSITTETGAYAHNVLADVRGLFNFAAERGLLEVPPTALVKARRLIGERQVRTRVLDDHELRALWNATATVHPHGDLVRFTLLTGARRSEVHGARWSEIDMTSRTWRIPASRYKSKEDHPLPLSTAAMTLLQGLPRDGDYVFGGAKPLGDLGRAKKIIANGSDWALHDLRRTFRTRLAALRVPFEVAELCIGHAAKGLARVYDQHEYRDEMRDAFQRWADELLKIVTPNDDTNVVRLHA